MKEIKLKHGKKYSWSKPISISDVSLSWKIRLCLVEELRSCWKPGAGMRRKRLIFQFFFCLFYSKQTDLRYYVKIMEIKAGKRLILMPQTSTRCGCRAQNITQVINWFSKSESLLVNFYINRLINALRALTCSKSDAMHLVDWHIFKLVNALGWILALGCATEVFIFESQSVWAVSDTLIQIYCV